MLRGQQLITAVNRIRTNIQRTGEPYDRLYSGSKRLVAYDKNGSLLVELYDIDEKRRMDILEKIIELARK